MINKKHLPPIRRIMNALFKTKRRMRLLEFRTAFDCSEKKRTGAAVSIWCRDSTKVPRSFGAFWPLIAIQNVVRVLLCRSRTLQKHYQVLSVVTEKSTDWVRGSKGSRRVALSKHCTTWTRIFCESTKTAFAFASFEKSHRISAYTCSCNLPCVCGSTVLVNVCAWTHTLWSVQKSTFCGNKHLIWFVAVESTVHHCYSKKSAKIVVTSSRSPPKWKDRWRCL